jgi:hypothetical protein
MQDPYNSQVNPCDSELSSPKCQRVGKPIYPLSFPPMYLSHVERNDLVWPKYREWSYSSEKSVLSFWCLVYLICDLFMFNHLFILSLLPLFPPPPFPICILSTGNVQGSLLCYFPIDTALSSSACIWQILGILSEACNWVHPGGLTRPNCGHVRSSCSMSENCRKHCGLPGLPQPHHTLTIRQPNIM